MLHCTTNGPGAAGPGPEHERGKNPPLDPNWSFEKTCIKEGIEQYLLDQIICPIGLNIGAESPEEIAVAVVAQIMASFKGADAESATWRN